MNAGDVTFVSRERELAIMAMAKLCFVEHFTLVAAVMEGQVFCDFLGQTLDVGPVRRAGHVEHKQV